MSNVSWDHLADLSLADPLSSESIDVLIGVDLYSELLLNGIRKSSSGHRALKIQFLAGFFLAPHRVRRRLGES